MDTKKKRDNIRELHINSTCCFEQILKATHHKTAVGPPSTSHLTKHPSKTNKICQVLFVNLRLTHERRSLMDFYTWTHQRWPS